MRLLDAKSRFNKRVTKTTSCWLWPKIKGHRYGQIKVGAKYLKAHRYSYELYKGKIPAGFYVCHRCDNGYCVNPDHLFLGTQFDNMKDMHNKGRANKAKGTKASKSRLSETEVLEIRSLIKNTNMTNWKIAKEFDVTSNTIRCIRERLSWRHLK